jgi:Chaperone of endosialidase
MQFNNPPRKIKNNMTVPHLKTSIGRSSSRLALLLTPLVLACFALAPVAQAKDHPTPTPTPSPTPTPTPPGEDRGNGNSAAEGVNALNPGTIGEDNTAHGWFSLFSNTIGSNNTANGYQALDSNTTGNNNTANGHRALAFSTTGNGNTANGAGALVSNTTGSSNTANGFQALFNNTTGNFNTANGHVALLSNTTGSFNAVNGFAALESNSTGDGNTANGDGALLSNTTGSYNTAIGHQADVGAGDLTNATAIGAGAVVNTSNKVRIGNSNVTVIEGQVAFTFPSDRNMKENFQPVDGEEVLRKIRQFNLTSWNYIGQDAKTLRHYGPMAQDFYEAFGHDAIGAAGTPTTINSGDMAGVMMIAIKALATENVQLKSAVANQEAVNAEQRRRLEALTARFEEQDKKIQKVSAQLEAIKPAPQMVNNP